MHPPTISNYMQDLRGRGQNFSFPTLLDSYRELLLNVSKIKQPNITKSGINACIAVKCQGEAEVFINKVSMGKN